MMNLFVFASTSVRQIRSLSFFIIIALSGACAVADSKTPTAANQSTLAVTNPAANAEPASKGATIPIEPNGPADTVRVFYKHLREKKFREALFLTNLRPAIEGLTDNELKDFAL